MTIPPDIDRLVHDVLSDFGAEGDAAAIVRRVRRLDYGLPAEDEFSVLCAWLGQCELIHKLDQKQTPIASKERFQVPDLLATFPSSGPVLIEVKVCNDEKLSFKAAYHTRLIRYAKELKLPLLIAWKYHSLWTLFEIRHALLAKTNFNIRVGEAMRQNLLGVLAGDVAYKLKPGAGIHLRMNKEEMVATEPSDNGFTETWQMRIGNVAFSRGGGERCKLDGETAQLLATWDLESTEDHHPDHINQSFVVPEETNMQFAHRALVHLLEWEAGRNSRASWRSLLGAPEITRTIKKFSAALERGLEEGVVSHVFHLQPPDQPDFLHER